MNSPERTLAVANADAYKNKRFADIEAAKGPAVRLFVEAICRMLSGGRAVMAFADTRDPRSAATLVDQLSSMHAEHVELLTKVHLGMDTHNISTDDHAVILSHMDYAKETVHGAYDVLRGMEPGASQAAAESVESLLKTCTGETQS